MRLTRIKDNPSPLTPLPQGTREKNNCNPFYEGEGGNYKDLSQKEFVEIETR